MRVATRAHLIALKVLARDDRNRPQDWDDLRALLRDATDEEVRRARDSTPEPLNCTAVGPQNRAPTPPPTVNSDTASADT